ncbi:MAG TPA: S41 family peptidase, partial [Gemmataceae bacterium]|nr:S41 family peptidase [Gemmataceae bacterium]
LYRFDLATEKAEKVPIRILDDRVAGRSRIVSLSKSISNYEIAPDGKRALFGARGEIFTVPAHSGPTRNLTASCGIHERNAKWSPDGKHIAYLSDQSGEDEIYLLAQDGKGSPVQLTHGGDTYKYEIRWSPDSQKILWSDKKLRLQYVDVQTKAVKQVAKSKEWEIRHFAWSPDSRWIAYQEGRVQGMSKVLLYALEEEKTVEVTDSWYESTEPVFSSDGKYLFFVSDRDFSPTLGRTEFNHIYQDMSRIYLVTLAKETESPFKPQSDEVGQVTPKAKDGAVKEVPSLKVDLVGLNDRIVVLPIAPSDYRNLASVADRLYYIRKGSKDAHPLLQMYDLGGRKETALGQVDGFEISADQKKMLVHKDGAYGIIDLPRGPAAVAITEPLNLSGLEMKLDRHQEWRQIFHECWRQMRDFFYDPNLHGVDWLAVRRKYEPLLAHVNHRADLTYIIGEMIGELNTGHTYVGGGDLPKPARVATGLLGAELRRDEKTGYYQITKILRGQNWERALRAPLTEVGVHAHVGDYILAIDGRPANELVNPYEALVNTAGKQVTLKLNAVAQEKGSREVIVTPVADDAELYYYTWVEDNIKKVSAATGGKVGYLHVPDMQLQGLNEFAKYFYPQLNKKALIIDVRGNGGGFVSQMLIERLRREMVMIEVARNSVPRPDPDSVMHGPMVCLLNEFSASDGDLFPYRFQKLKMGKLIGKRSWGGVVGIRESLPLVDGGVLNKPEFAPYDLEGKKWIIEGHGVDPDVVVDNDPAKEFAGTDEQLDRAIAVILEELQKHEKTLPPVPPFPKK